MVSVPALRFYIIAQGHQFVYLVGFVVSNAFQNPCEPSLWIYLVEFGGFDEGEGNGHRITAARRAREHPVLRPMATGFMARSAVLLSRSKKPLSR